MGAPKKKINCWSYGFLLSAAIMLLTWVPMFIIHGLPGGERAVTLAFTGAAILALGTAIFGGLRRLELRRRKTENN